MRPRDDHPIVLLRHDALHRQPGGMQAVERSQQLVVAAGIEQSLGPVVPRVR